MDIEQIKADLKAIEKAPATSQEHWDAFRRLERDRYECAQAVIDLTAERDAWQKTTGAIIATIPLPDVLGASRTVGDAIEYLKATFAERDRLLAANRDLVRQVAKQEAALREFVTAAEKAKKAYIVPQSVLDVLGYQKGSDHE